MITAFILFVTSFLLGYFIGQGKLTVQAIQEAKKEIEKKLDKTPLGVVRRPDAKTIRKWANPKEQAGIDAMTETLKQIPELNN